MAPPRNKSTHIQPTTPDIELKNGTNTAKHVATTPNPNTKSKD